jgi:hypothetical protein
VPAYAGSLARTLGVTGSRRCPILYHSRVLDFDLIDEWAPRLELALEKVVPPAARTTVATSHPQFFESALSTLLKHTDREAVTKSTLAWIRGQEVAAYHGTRLNSAETQSIRTLGLKPLLPEQRKPRLARALCTHPLWSAKASLLDDAIRTHSGKGKSGRREGQVHLSLSRAGLTDGFNHYLTHGSEFDQNVAHEILGQTGVDLLATDGLSTVITVSVPGDRALHGANRFATEEERISRGEIPNIARQLLQAWAFKLVDKSYQTVNQRLDCGICLTETLPPEWVTSIQGWSP